MSNSMLFDEFERTINRLQEQYPDGLSEIYTISEYDFRAYFLGSFSGNETDPARVVEASRSWMRFTKGTGVAKIINNKGVEIARTPECLFNQALQTPSVHEKNLEARYESLLRVGMVNPTVAAAQYHMIGAAFFDVNRLNQDDVRAYIQKWYTVIKKFLPEDKIKLNFVGGISPGTVSNGSPEIKTDGDADFIEPDLC